MLTTSAATATATDSVTGTASWSFAAPTATPPAGTSSTAGMLVVPGSGMDVFQRYEYTGRELASESNEYYFRYRVYGPALGQFFTRDPLGYEDGMGLYGGAFANKAAIDPTGLRFNNPIDDPIPRGTCVYCGPDVTAQVRRTVNVLEGTLRQWEASDPSRLAAVCGYVFYGINNQGRPPWAAMKVAWDMVELHMQAVPESLQGNIWKMGACSSGPCANTVWFMGQCYYAGSVNYLMFGVLARRCSIKGSRMIDYIWGYKGPWLLGDQDYFGAENLFPSIEFAVAGYEGWPTLNPAAQIPPGDRPACRKCPLGASWVAPQRFQIHMGGEWF